jgi:hypothetical protein
VVLQLVDGEFALQLALHRHGRASDAWGFDDHAWRLLQLSDIELVNFRRVLERGLIHRAGERQRYEIGDELARFVDIDVGVFHRDAFGPRP